VQNKLMKNLLNIHAWFIDLEQHIIFEWNSEEGEFQPIGKELLGEGFVEERGTAVN
jgi:hypothetical protein